MDDGDSRCPKSVVNELIPALSFGPAVGIVVKLYYEPDAESCRIACHNVDMLALDSVEGVLPTAFVQAAFYFHHVCQTDFPHEPMATVDGLFQYAQERALGGRKQSLLFLIRVVLRFSRLLLPEHFENSSTGQDEYDDDDQGKKVVEHTR